MSAKTGIEWTEATYNPWRGCTKVSPGCARCYMFREQTRYGRDPEVVTRAAPATFSAPLKWSEPRTIFTCSWSDWFHEAADGWRDEAWDIIRRTPQHTYQILTKRPERMRDHLPLDWGEGWPNVWLGVSVENQRWMGRCGILQRVPARVRFLSCEPLLGPLMFDLDQGSPGNDPDANYLAGIDWVIVGGESGPGARAMRVDWARQIRDQCASAGIAFFLKQLGGWPNKRGGDAAVLDGVRHTAMPLGAHV